MTSSIYAYAFVKAAYGEGLRNPVDAVVPLVKRALMKFGAADIDQAKIQERIKNSIGLDIPRNVIRYTFPVLASEKVLYLDEKHVYRLVDPNYIDPEVAQLELDARARFDRLRARIERTFIDHGIRNLNAEELLEQWLDDSSLSFLGNKNPAFNADKRDLEINKVIYLAITESDDGFLDDLTEVALGDALFRAIRAVTEYEADPALAGSSAMENVVVYFDTGFVLRALGLGFPEFTQAAEELLALCRSTGCRLCVFKHNAEEIQRIVATVANAMAYSGEIEGQVASYAYERGLSPAELIDYASSIEDHITSLGLEVKEAPALTEMSKELSIDELKLDDQLKRDLKQANDQARVTDVKSLAAVFRLREGRGKKFLERCDAIFITANRGLADSSVRFFQNLFREDEETNVVQLCMTDVVFATRLWTKLPTSLNKLPKAQIVSHILGQLRPTKRLKDDFLKGLQDCVKNGDIPEEAAIRIKLSRFVEYVLATEFDVSKTDINRREVLSVAKKVIEKQRALQNQIKADIENATRREVRKDLDDTLAELTKAERKLNARNSDIDALREEIEQNEVKIRELENARIRIQAIVEKVMNLAIHGIVGIVAFSIVWTAVERYFPPSILGESASIFFVFLQFCAASLLAWLSMKGYAMSSFTAKLENKAVKMIMRAVFG